MECNRDEAIRAKQIAEKKLAERDYHAAKKFALKAQNLYPELEGLAHMLVSIDVYISAENKTGNGEVNWCSVLGISPMDDDETVRKQYRKLALMLHPDKNKSLGADGAFKLVSQAWSLLSDKTRRLDYNNQLNCSSSFQQRSCNASHAPKGGLGLHTQKSNNFTHSSPSSVHFSSHAKPTTFWTLCNRCKTQYEYLRLYLNHTLLCPNCSLAFLAVEKPPPPNVVKSPKPSSPLEQRNSAHCASNGSSTTNSKNFGCSPPPSATSHGPSVVQQRCEQLKKMNVSSQAASGVRETGNCLKRTNNEPPLPPPQPPQVASRADQLLKRQKSSIHSSAANDKMYAVRDVSLVELQNLLINKAQADIRKKLAAWNYKPKAVSEDNNGGDLENHDNCSSKKGRGEEEEDDEDNHEGTTGECCSEDAAAVSMNVPDSDFHNFDSDRPESSFEEDQIWAAYDGDDGMPRFYARVHKVISLRPFKIRISWLNSKNSSEFSDQDWVGSGFPKTCGDFRIGRHEISDTLNSFSHMVKWKKGTRGVIQILPRKGDVWALYKNWSRDWNCHTPDEVVHKYDMVEVLDDYHEEEGIPVASLAKVSGFKTVFRKHGGPDDARRIVREEMFRFSHQVPNHLLTGEEGPSAPKGCHELDPAAIPLELLHEDVKPIAPPPPLLVR